MKIHQMELTPGQAFPEGLLLESAFQGRFLLYLQNRYKLVQHTTVSFLTDHIKACLLNIFLLQMRATSMLFYTKYLIRELKPASMKPKITAKTATKMHTIITDPVSSSFVGHVTFLSSALTSLKNVSNLVIFSSL